MTTEELAKIAYYDRQADLFYQEGEHRLKIADWYSAHGDAKNQERLTMERNHLCIIGNYFKGKANEIRYADKQWNLYQEG